MDSEIVKWIVTILVSALCGGLGGSIYTHWINRPRLIVKGRYVPGETEEDILEDTVRFDLVNPSPRKITLVAVGFIAKPRKDYVTFIDNAYEGDNSLPHTLGESELFSVYILRSHVPPFDTIEYVIAKDSAEKIHKSAKRPLGV